MQDYWGIALLRMGHINIYLARFDTNVAPVADFRIEYHRLVRRLNIGNGKYFFLLGHFNLQTQLFFEK